MTLIMDTYAICRFLYYHSKQPEGSTSIFIAGAFHTQTYSLFMKEFKNVVLNSGQSGLS